MAVVLAIMGAVYWHKNAYADSKTVVKIDTPCSAVSDYINNNQTLLRIDTTASGSSSDLDGSTSWDFHLPKISIRTTPHTKALTCKCSGKQVTTSYANDCPEGIKCFTDYTCPYGDDCLICVDADVRPLIPAKNRVDQAMFHWAPTGGPLECKASLEAFNARVDAHEGGHAEMYRRDIDAWRQKYPASSFHRHECGDNELAVENQIKIEITEAISQAVGELDDTLHHDTDLFHHSHGEVIAPPDCTCGDR